MHDYQDTAMVSKPFACKVEGFPTLFEMDASAQGPDLTNKFGAGNAQGSIITQC